MERGWLERQVKRITEDTRDWPKWLRQEAGLREPADESFAETPPPGTVLLRPEGNDTHQHGRSAE